MTTAEIIAIGTEMLLGDNVDTNTAYIARHLRELGIDLFRTSIVGDNQERIVAMIRESLQRAQIVITTGGLGPTVDDPTRAAVASAFYRELVFHDVLWESIQARFQLLNRPATENNRVQAFIPEGAIAVQNPVGTAPAFIVEQEDRMVTSLPGVPGEMEIILQESILPFIQKKYQIHSVIMSTILHCSGIGESMVDEMISDLERSQNPTVGLLAHPGLVDVRITARAENTKAAAELIDPFRAQIKARLTNNIFGEGSQSLSSVVSDRFKEMKINLRVVTTGLDHEELVKIIPGDLQPYMNFTKPHADYPKSAEMKNGSISPVECFDPCLEIHFFDESSRSGMALSWSWNDKQAQSSRFFAGPNGALNTWRRNMILDFIRRNLS